MKLMRKNGGFTLVELIVVIAILAILAGIAVPAYSGYIQKAEKAADLQLLGAINEAFAASCVASGAPVTNVSSATLQWSGQCVTGVATVSGTDIDADDCKANFEMLFGGNTTTQFKVIEANSLVFDTAKSVFVDPTTVPSVTVSYNGKPITYNAADAKKYRDSAWGQVDSGEILEMVTNVTDLAAGIANETWENMLEDPAYRAACAEAMGYDSVEEWDEAFAALLTKKDAELIAAGLDRESDEYQEAYGAYAGQLMANNTVLVAAKNAQGNSETILGTLTQNGGKDAKDLIKAEMQTNPANGLSQAALTYGLYTSFMMENDPDFDPSKMEDPTEALDYLDDPDFQKYLSEGNGKTDLDGYVAALNTAGKNTGDGVGADIVENGFAGNASLEELMKQMLGR